MSYDQATIDAFSQKITSESQLASLRGKHYVVASHPRHLLLAHDDTLGDLGVTQDTTAWWMHREMIREAVGVYPEPTSVIAALRHGRYGLSQYVIHISKDDPTMIAYTPDTNAGVQDRQVRTTLGKLLRKFFLTMPDHVIQRIEAAHRAELDPTFEIARTPEEVEMVYTQMQGDSGCMRHRREHFNLTSAHPSHVYADVPGMGVAYIRGADGAIKSRSVIWDNPADPTDKRYVRLYGDSVLKKKLERQGYKLKGLAGAKVRVVRDESWTDDDNERDAIKVVMPYVDMAGGSGNPDADRTGDPKGGVILESDPEFVLLTSENHTYQNMGYSPCDIKDTDGFAFAPVIPRNFAEFTDVRDGNVYPRATTPRIFYMTDEGVLGETKSTVPVEAYHHIMAADYVRPTTQRSYLCSEAAYNKFSVPGHPGIYNDEASRTLARLVKLDPTFYPDAPPEGIYAKKSEVTAIFTDVRTRIDQLERYLETYVEPEEGWNDADSFVLTKDTATLHIKNNVTHTVSFHTGEMPVLKKMGYIAVGISGGRRRVGHKDDKNMRTTVSGRRVMIGVHDVVQLYNGDWDFNRNVETRRLLNFNLNVPKDTVTQDIRLTEKFFIEHCSALNIVDAHQRLKRMAQTARAGIDNLYAGVYENENGVLAEVTGWIAPAYHQLVAGAKRTLADHAADPVAFVGDNPNRAARLLCWAENVVTLDRAHDQVVADIYEAVEANAMEYPNRLKSDAEIIDEMTEAALRSLDADEFTEVTPF